MVQVVEYYFYEDENEKDFLVYGWKIFMFKFCFIVIVGLFVWFFFIVFIFFVLIYFNWFIWIVLDNKKLVIVMGFIIGFVSVRKLVVEFC